MISRRFPALAVLAAVWTLMFSGVAFASGGPADSGSRSSPGSGDLTGGFVVSDLSGETITATGVDKDDNGAIQMPPPDRWKLDPGEDHDWEVVWYLFYSNNPTVHYVIANQDGSTTRFDLHLYLDTGGINAHASCDFLGSTTHLCTVTKTPSTGQMHIQVMDAGHPVFDVGGDKAQQEAQLLNTLCTADGIGDCTFTPAKDEHTQSAPRIVGQALADCSTNESETTLEYSDDVGVSDAIDVKVDGKLLGVIGPPVEATYHHEVTETHTFSQSVDLKIEPGQIGWVSDLAPVYRDTGEFTVALGNSTWHLHDVSFDSPDKGGTGVFAAHGVAMTDAQKAKYCGGKPPGLVPVPDNEVPSS
ncbi:hypothetical protein ACIRS1_05655 [Kitasatospora sp. NPDC101176]|uniref:hypothetical protein n=1 Tax=Kitasatospora sp. NPDC101176 TaxID=3364099 RepID=UPI0037FB0289